ncbi:P-loop containing nucleoside triphosphate hydrolase protein [Mycena galopus ATCC 62051]|nr:P-loop containing nucleoside triphosphate hydrolase protein [Mycena galopus ATCC 62051]
MMQHRLSTGYRWLHLTTYPTDWLQRLQTATEISPLLQRIHFFLMFSPDEEVTEPRSHVALRAWTAWRVATLTSNCQRLTSVPRIDTRPFSQTRLCVLSKLAQDLRRIAKIKPMRVENEVDSENFSCKDGKLDVTSTRFQTRVLTTRNQCIEVESTVGDKVSKFSGKAVLVEGRAAHITLTSSKPTLGLKVTGETETIRVTTVGREGPSRSEVTRMTIVRTTLQGKCTILAQPFFQALWLAGANDEPWPKWTKGVPYSDVGLYFPQAKLNGSQCAAVRAILSNKDEERVTLVQGPPGTGKTTVIAAVVSSILSSAYDTERTVWVVAQSNVAVKNIAEKLADVDCDFTLLVSKEFHYDWHEHLYGKIMDSVLRSDDLTDDFDFIEQRMLHSRVVLCTLSMLSNPRLSTITRLVPLETLMVDEASQVEIGDFVPVLARFSPSLQKMVFIGDDKQREFISAEAIAYYFTSNECVVPPHGANKIWSLQSVFEMPHLRQTAIFLDTQYRMPQQLGSFIGKRVYDGKLKTVHHNSARCCWFIDVKGLTDESRTSRRQK